MRILYDYALAFLITSLWMIIGTETCAYVTRCFDSFLNMETDGKCFCLLFAAIFYVFVSSLVWGYVKDRSL